MTGKAIDWSLYLVLERSMIKGRSLEEFLVEAVLNGVGVVQLREKESSAREFLEIARVVRDILAPYKVPLLINDRLDVAVASGAHGVHLGQSDMPYREARKMLGGKAIIGLTVSTMDEVRLCEDFDVDYLGVSAIFPTPTKSDVKHIIGLEGLKKMRKISRHTLIGIGGINAGNAGEVIKAGADGIAVVSAICASTNPAKSAAELSSIIKKSKKEKTGV